MKKKKTFLGDDKEKKAAATANRKFEIVKYYI